MGQKLEDFIPVVKFDGLNTDKAVAFGSTLAVTGAITATGGVVGGSTASVETVITTNVITAAESGKTFFLSLANGFTSTLPAPAAGLNYRFVVAIAPTTAYVIATNGGADIMIGGVNELETDTGDDGPYDDNADAFNFVANVAVVGDWVDFVSDGTSWYFNGQVKADGAVTTSTT